MYELYLSGEKVRDIAEKWDCCPITVYKRFRRAGYAVVDPRVRRAHERAQRAVELRNKGLILSEIARQLDMSIAGVHRLLNAAPPTKKSAAKQRPLPPEIDKPPPTFIRRGLVWVPATPPRTPSAAAHTPGRR